MKSLSKVLVETSGEFNDKLSYGTLELYVDTSWRPEHHKIQNGVAHDDFGDLGIRKGDTLWFHYLALKEELMLAEGDGVRIYAIEPELFYCIERGGELIMLNNHTFVGMVMEEKKSSIIETLKKVSEVKGVVAHGNQKGSTVSFPSSRAFINNISGVDYYVMREDDLLVVWD